MHNTLKFEDMCWHDNAIHGISIIENDAGPGNLVFDIDYILEWLKPQNNIFNFRIAPATLTFYNVTDLIISIDYAKPTACVQPMTIAEIIREPQNYPIGHTSYKWNIEINWPSGSYISFNANKLSQVLRSEPIISGAQYLSQSERTAVIPNASINSDWLTVR